MDIRDLSKQFFLVNVPVIFNLFTTFHHEERSSRIFIGAWKIILVFHFLTHVVTEKSKPLYFSSYSWRQ